MEAAGPAFVALRREATSATGNNGPMFLAAIAQIAVVVFEIPQLPSGKGEVVVKQAIVRRSGTQWVGICGCDEAAEVILDLVTIGRIGPIQVINAESIGEPQEAMDVT